MKADELRVELSNLGLSYSQAAVAFEASVSTVKMVASGKRPVPAEWSHMVTKLKQAVTEAVTMPAISVTSDKTAVTIPGSVIPPVTSGHTVIRPTDDENGDVAFDIMSDGFARGYPGDSFITRAQYRTAHAWRRICEARSLALASDRITHMGKLPRSFKITAEGTLTTLSGEPIKTGEDKLSETVVPGEHKTRRT